LFVSGAAGFRFVGLGLLSLFAAFDLTFGHGFLLPRSQFCDRSRDIVIVAPDWLATPAQKPITAASRVVARVQILGGD
jgi:hypothetical protein